MVATLDDPTAIRAYNYVYGATGSLLVYELMTSLDEERKAWSLKGVPWVIFFLNRYFIRGGLVFLWVASELFASSERLCQTYDYLQIGLYTLALFSAQALVLIRLWVICEKSAGMFWFLVIIYTMEAVLVVICILMATVETRGADQQVCSFVSHDDLLQRYASGFSLAPVVFEFVVCLITLVKLGPRDWATFPRILKVLAQDYAVYFIFIFALTLANAIIYSFEIAKYYRPILLGPTTATICIVVSRITLHTLKMANCSPPNSPSGSMDIDFGDMASSEDAYNSEDQPMDARGGTVV
ncbi:hypothetical protein B0H10DRAFT_2093779 [Mycena sp. CBHHK59/15]|nr:hypothetical protein B0H10DRAFT_2093779 [Mycena sp. CBHHK59/15]